MASEHPEVDFYYSREEGRYFAFKRGELIVRPSVEPGWRDIIADRRDPDATPLPDELVIGTAVIHGEEFLLIGGLERAELIDRARERADLFEPNHVYWAAQVGAWASHGHECCPHWSQTPREGGIHELTANWVRELPVKGALGAGAQASYSGMRASPLHMNPLHMNPLHMNPLHMNPLHMNPLHMNPLHMNGYVSNAIPATRERQCGPVSPGETDGEGVYVHIIDSGLGKASYASPYLPAHTPAVSGDSVDEPDRISAWDSAAIADGFIDPVAGHGTFIAGIYAQLLPRAEIHVDAALTAAGYVTEWDAVLSVISMIAMDKSSAVLNLSFGGTIADFESPATFLLMKLAIQWASSMGYVVVASAGNVSSCDRHYPAALDEVVGVGALDRNGVAWFSNYGDWVECWAPGVDLISTFLVCNGAFRPFLDVLPDGQMDGTFKSPWATGATTTEFAGFDDPDDFSSSGSHGWAAWSGTSFAAPVVGAAAARLLGGGMSGSDVITELKTVYPLVDKAIDDE